MKITWQGHACFYIEGRAENQSQTIRVVTDPYTPAIAGLAPLTREADVVIMSSDCDNFHSDAAGVPGHPVVVNALEVARGGGSREVLGVQFSAIESKESLTFKASPDDNALYRFALDGVGIGHMGDVGNPLTGEQIEFLRGVDVLLALTGGHYTIALDDLDIALRQIRPKLVIPMHFLIPNLRLDVADVFAFTSRYSPDTTAFVGDITLELSRESLPSDMRIAVLRALANEPE